MGMGIGFSGKGWGWISSSRGWMGMGINGRPRAALYSEGGDQKGRRNNFKVGFFDPPLLAYLGGT